MTSPQKYLLLVCSFVFLPSGVAHAQAPVNRAPVTLAYVQVDQENIRLAPKGPIIGTAVKGTELEVLGAKGKWVRVRLDGWMWMPSLSGRRPPVAGEFGALQIVVKTRAEADEILASLKTGADFTQIALGKSIGPNAKRGGDLGYFRKGDFRAEFEQAILALKVGDISGIVKSEQGYHIFKRTN